jgi:opacity protein-like surface antigen
MKSSLIILLLSICPFIKSAAQQDSVVIPEPKQYEWNSHLYIGAPLNNFSFSNYSQLKNTLNNQGISFPAIKLNNTASFGIAIQKRRYKFGFEGTYGLPSTNANQKKATKTSLSFVSYNFNAGYALIFERNTQWFLNVGVGVIESTLHVSSTSNTQTVNFNTLLTAASVGYSPVLSHVNPFLDISIEQTFRPKRPISFNPVFRLGYRVGVNSLPWKTDANFTTLNAPTDRINQLFFQSIFVISNNKTKAQREARKKQNANNDWGLNPR